MPFSAGDRAGPYEVLGPIGSGGMGAVYRARDTRLGREVALKCVRPDPDGTPSGSVDKARARILREARTASKLHHPNICTVFDVGEDRGEAWIAMELVEGEALSAVVTRGALPPEVVMRYGTEIADALGHAHASGIVHRDLKPANVVIGADGRVKLLDFGIAARLPQDTAAVATKTTESVAGWTGPLAGTVPYMAPETLRGEAPGTAADLWAMGVVLYELVTGRRPFTGDTPVDLVSAILTRPPEPLPASVPRPLAAAVERLLQKDPALRFRSAGEVRAVLEGLAGESARPPARPVVRRRRRVPWIAAAAAVVVVAGAAGAAWWSSRDRTLVLRDHQLLSTLAGSYRSPTFSPDGSLVAYVAPDAKGVRQIWVRDFTEGKPVQITSGAAHASRPRWSPKNDRIYFGRDGAGLWSVPPLGGVSTRLVEAGRNPSVSGDGTRLVYERAAEVWTANADGSQPHKVEGVPSQYYSIERRPAISPDGRWIVVFRAGAGPNGDLWLVPSGGGDARQLTFDLREGGSPVWTPDGRRIVFSSARAGSRTLWQIPAGGGVPEPLTTGSGDDDEPEISRDGTRLVYTNVKRSWTLFVRDATSAAPRVLLDKHTEIAFPLFSPDGTRLVFFGQHISSIRTDGTDLRQLTPATELNHMPTWSVDGTSVYFFQIQPTLSFRRMSAEGGPSEAVLPWNWEVQNGPRFDPSGRRLVYGRRGPDAATIVRELDTGAERALPVALYRPTWSPDGRWVTGSSAESDVIRCDVDENRCVDVTRGLHPRFDTAGATIWFLRLLPGSPMCEVRSINLATKREESHGQIGPFRPIDRHFDRSIRGEIAWAPMHEGLPELWAAGVK